MRFLLALAALLASAFHLDAQFSSNATKLRGRPICATAPADTNTLAWSVTKGCWDAAAAISGGFTPDAATGLPASTLSFSSWTNVNGGVVNDSDPSGISFYATNSGLLNWRLYERSLQSLTTYTVAMIVDCARITWGLSSLNCGALYLYDGTKVEGYETLYQASGSNQLRIEKLTNVTTDSSTPFGATTGLTSNLLTVKVVEDTTHRTWFHWAAGAWVQDLQETTGTFLTPTQFGFGGISVTAASYGYSNPVLKYYCLAATISISTSSTCL